MNGDLDTRYVNSIIIIDSSCKEAVWDGVPATKKYYEEAISETADVLINLGVLAEKPEVVIMTEAQALKELVPYGPDTQAVERPLLVIAYDYETAPKRELWFNNLNFKFCMRSPNPKKHLNILHTFFRPLDGWTALRTIQSRKFSEALMGALVYDAVCDRKTVARRQAAHTPES